MDPSKVGADLLKNPQFVELFQKALGDEKIPDEKDPKRAEWLKKMQEKLQKQSMEEMKTKLETPQSDEEGQWMWILPEPGFCIKCATTTGGKVFINICQHKRIAEPIPLSDEEQEESDTIKFKIPLSCGAARLDLDKAGKECKVYDVVVNPSTIHRCREESEFRRFVAALCMTWIKQKSEPTLNADEFKNINITCKGKPEMQRIRLAQTPKGANAMNDEINLPQTKASATAPSAAGGREQGKSLVQEIEPKDDKPQPSASVEEVGHYNWGVHKQAAKNPFFRENVPEIIIVKITIPGISTVKEIDVQCQQREVRLVYVDNEHDEPFLVVPLRFPVAADPASAKFIKSKCLLTLTLTVSLPDESEKVATNVCRDVEEEEREEEKKKRVEMEERIRLQQEKRERILKEEQDVINQKKELLENMQAVQAGDMPPSLKTELDNMPPEQLKAMMIRLDSRTKKGDSIDVLLERMSDDVLFSTTNYIRKKLGLKENKPPESQKHELKEKVDTEKVEYNFAKKAENLFGILMNNRYVFALDQ